jgi:hypothetical protein
MVVDGVGKEECWRRSKGTPRWSVGDEQEVDPYHSVGVLVWGGLLVGVGKRFVKVLGSSASLAKRRGRNWAFLFKAK